MSCIEQMKYRLYLERTSFKEAREYIEKNWKRSIMSIRATRSSRTITS